MRHLTNVKDNLKDNILHFNNKNNEQFYILQIYYYGYNKVCAFNCPRAVYYVH